MSVPNSLLETYLAIRNQLSRFVLGIVPPKEVEDIVQETYVRVCQSNVSDSVREPRSFIFRTAKNLALDHLKRAEVRLADGQDRLDEHLLAGTHDQQRDDQTFSDAATDEEFVLFCAAVRELPKQCRRAFVLKKVYGYTLKEIAATMDVSVSTVESHVVQGTKKCVLYLRDQQRAAKGAPSGRIAGRSSSRQQGEKV